MQQCVPFFICEVEHHSLTAECVQELFHDTERKMSNDKFLISNKFKMINVKIYIQTHSPQ